MTKQNLSLPSLIFALMIVIGFTACQQSTDEGANNQLTNNGIANNQAKKAQQGSEVISQDNSPITVKKKRKHIRGSSYFDFNRNTTEARLADQLETPSKTQSTRFFLNNVTFNGATISKGSSKQINNLAKVLAAYPYKTVALVAHPKGDNMEGKRAEAVQKALTSKGINKKRIPIQKYQGNNPKKNGQIELKVVDK